MVSGTAARGTLDAVGVKVRVDSGDCAAASGNHTWQLILNTTEIRNGRHTIQARAFDGMDYLGVANRTVTVDHPGPGGKGFMPGFEGTITLIVPAASAVAMLRRRSGGV